MITKIGKFIIASDNQEAHHARNLTLLAAPGVAYVGSGMYPELRSSYYWSKKGDYINQQRAYNNHLRSQQSREYNDILNKFHDEREALLKQKNVRGRYLASLEAEEKAYADLDKKYKALEGQFTPVNKRSKYLKEVFHDINWKPVAKRVAIFSGVPMAAYGAYQYFK